VFAFGFFYHFRVLEEWQFKTERGDFDFSNSDRLLLDAGSLAPLGRLSTARRAGKRPDLPLHLGYPLYIRMFSLVTGTSLKTPSTGANIHENHKGSFTSNFKLTSVSVR